MVQGGDSAGLLLKAALAFGIVGETSGKDLNCDGTPKPGILCAIDFPHSAGAERTGNLIRAEPRA